MMRLKLGLAALLLAVPLGCLPGKKDDSPEPPDREKERMERVKARDAALKSHHDRCESLFVKAQDNGIRRMPVLSHGSPDYPGSLHFGTADQDDNAAAPWHMSKVELVSLLNDPKKPAVHEATGMRQIFRRPAARELDGFETAALGYLQAGENLMVSESAGHVRAMGAIRMRADCQTCHAGKPVGTLLGAFTYSFKAGPAPAKAAAPVPVPVPKP